ncbi:MAG: sulfatase-like hydrolase/transferase [Muribaculaceae bacterium]|nr:sulfatase-like hydrolase/transferase [Muribaculaceae bacterium]
MKHSLRFNTNIYIATVYQFLISVILLWITRLIFYYYNEALIGTMSGSHLWHLMLKGIRFDLSAAAYFNALFLIMRFIPAPFVMNKRYIAATNCVYYITNSLMLIINLVDVPFFPFLGNRMRFSTLTEQFTDSNMVVIVASYAVQYWWAYLLVGCAIALLVWLARRAHPVNMATLRTHRATIAARIGLFLFMAATTFMMMRGVLTLHGGTPLSIGHAAQGLNRNSEINVVLNTPFCILRSTSGTETVPPYHFFTPEQIDSLRTSVITPPVSAVPNRKNVVLIIMEGGGSCFIDHINPVTGGNTGLMPFLDSLSRESLCVFHTIASGRRSNEGITSVIGSLPNFEPFLFRRSPYTANDFDSYPQLLRDSGYSSVFYHGSSPGSYNIEQIAMTMGMERTVNRETYGNEDDFDGMWGIFDSKMAEYMVHDLSQQPQPFNAIWFTLTTHSPFSIPKDWDKSAFKNQDPSMSMAVEYLDQSLRLFFREASKHEWYRNTIFVFTADHGNRDWPDTRYDTKWYHPHIPFIAYAPARSIKPQLITDRIMSQFDIGPTILGLTGYDRPYVSMGIDVLADSTATKPHYALNFFNNQFQINGLHYLVRWEPQSDRITDVFDITTDPELTKPLENYDTDEVEQMRTWAKAFLQDYSARITSNRLSIKNQH